MAKTTEIRHATFDDLADVARLHVAVWRQAYAGLVPDAYLAGIDEAQRLQRWQQGFTRSKEKGDTVSGVQIAYVDGTPVGFISYGKSRDADRADWAEIYAAYLSQEHWGSGVGYQLFQAARDAFKAKGFTQAFLWVLGSNANAINSYIKWGGVVEPTRTKDFDAGGLPLEEVTVSFTL